MTRAPNCEEYLQPLHVRLGHLCSSFVLLKPCCFVFYQYSAPTHPIPCRFDLNPYNFFMMKFFALQCPGRATRTAFAAETLHPGRTVPIVARGGHIRARLQHYHRVPLAPNLGAMKLRRSVLGVGESERNSDQDSEFDAAMVSTE
jgi:hypothetical protein